MFLAFFSLAAQFADLSRSVVVKVHERERKFMFVVVGSIAGIAPLFCSILPKQLIAIIKTVLDLLKILCKNCLRMFPE